MFGHDVRKKLTKVNTKALLKKIAIGFFVIMFVGICAYISLLFLMILF